MNTESKLQTKIIRYLKEKGCYVIKTKPGPGIPVGCPDIVFLLEGFWGALEVKATPKSKYQPLQMETLVKLSEWSWARRVDPMSWLQIRSELEQML